MFVSNQESTFIFIIRGYINLVSVGGVVDTLADANKAQMAELLDYDFITKEDLDAYVEATKKAIREEAYKRIKADANDYAWSKVATEWLAFFKGNVKNG